MDRGEIEGPETASRRRHGIITQHDDSLTNRRGGENVRHHDRFVEADTTEGLATVERIEDLTRRDLEKGESSNEESVRRDRRNVILKGGMEESDGAR